MQDRRSYGTVRDVAGWAGDRPEVPRRHPQRAAFLSQPERHTSVLVDYLCGWVKPRVAIPTRAHFVGALIMYWYPRSPRFYLVTAQLCATERTSAAFGE